MQGVSERISGKNHIMKIITRNAVQVKKDGHQKASNYCFRAQCNEGHS